MPVKAVVIASLLLTGCAGAEIVSLHGNSASPHAPSNEAASRGGVMKYESGNPGHAQRGRDDAYKKMHEFCRGPYKITQESLGKQTGDVVPYAGVYWVDNQEFVYLNFECE